MGACLHGLLSGMSHCLVKMWASKRYWLLLFFMWALILLCGNLSSGFSNYISPDQYITDNGNGQSLKEEAAWDSLLNFFFPTTCIVKENQVVMPCIKDEDLEERKCLRYKCCFSSSETSKFRCFAPLKDKPKQMLRIFGFGVINMIILGCLPIFCCSLFRRSKLAYYLQRIVDNIFKCLRNRRNRPNDDTEMIGRAVEGEESEEVDDDEESEEDSQENRALLSW
ncbi:PREDICTED: fragile X mental retardation 1 neighbor protein [Galeopterus variegatus]|uniref:Fragile X mental retardation 1 neighbor protein n=1 Tax=Galeopterus variegatus TaxID=482537 RepID=A0ABM0QQ32_GALVR|nr:PREDICTED: fragile X mental retardation 1 neighbor protein [Galeopterus variegatus]